MAEESVNELLKKYRETGDIRYRNRFAEEYLYIAEILAKKFVGRGVPYDDLYQEASLSLLRGIERFDPDKGLQFSTYITPTITGELKNYFRDKLRVVKPPRRWNEINLAAKKFSEKVFAETGEKPTVSQIAKRLGVEEEELIKALLTDADGRTDEITLSAPSKNYSLAPNEPRGFSNYNIRVDYPGYYTAEQINVPVFPGITSIQQVPLIPLPLDTYTGKKKIFISEPLDTTEAEDRRDTE